MGREDADAAAAAATAGVQGLNIQDAPAAQEGSGAAAAKPPTVILVIGESTGAKEVWRRGA